MMNQDELNPAQQAAVEYCDGPSLVIAGAGSGKTRVLTHKIAHLLTLGMEPWKILALTFTNKAAEEMKSRIALQVGAEQAKRLWMGTFHSIFARILRTEHEAIGFSANYTIYDAADSKSLVKSIIPYYIDLEIEPIVKDIQARAILDETKKIKIKEVRDKISKLYSPSYIISRISSLKNRLILPNDYIASTERKSYEEKDKIKYLADIYRDYVEQCKQSNALDFDDILVYTYLLFKHRPEILAKYEEHFDFVLVDEYQDTNYAQHAIVWQLTQNKQRVCVVGDDAQSIYSFRGANIDNILTFQQLYKGVKLFKLERNYRSTQNIVKAANSVIKHNRGQIYKEVYSEKVQGEPIHVYGFYSDLEEAAGVAKKLLSLNRFDHIPWNEIAILYRTNVQSRTFEEAFRKQNIPYRIYGGLSFYQRKEIKDVIAYFRLAINPDDVEAFKRIINYPARGIGQSSVNRILDVASKNNISVWQVISHIQNYDIKINRGTEEKIVNFVQLIDSFRSDINTQDAATLGKRIVLQSGMWDEIFRNRAPEDISRQENLQELLDGLQQFVDERVEEEGNERVYMTHYLQEVSLISDLDESNDDQTDKVSLMTIHSAKGLEFRVVFIVGMEENLFPNQMAATSPREMEEERRLFYVALTRAEEQCYLTHAQNRYRYGKSEFCTPSSFLKEIAPQFVKQENTVSSAPRPRSFMRFGLDDEPSSTSRLDSSFRKFDSSAQMRFQTSRPATAQEQSVEQTQTNAGTLSVGSQIEHSRFGRGEVVALSGKGIDAKATVRFENVGTKQLLLRFAKFTIL